MTGYLRVDSISVIAYRILFAILAEPRILRMRTDPVHKKMYLHASEMIRTDHPELIAADIKHHPVGTPSQQVGRRIRALHILRLLPIGKDNLIQPVGEPLAGVRMPVDIIMNGLPFDQVNFHTQNYKLFSDL